MRTVRCDRCRGTGEVEIEDAEAPCDAEIVVGGEVVECFATRQHPGAPHMAILCNPCPGCGGYDECQPWCAVYEMEPRRKPEEWWWFWADGDLALTRASDEDGQAWRNRYQPSSPWAKAS